MLATWTPFPVKFVTKNFNVSFLDFYQFEKTFYDLLYFNMCVKYDVVTLLISFWTVKPRYWMKKPNHVTSLMGNSVVTNTWPSSSLNLKLNWQGCLQIKCQFNFKQLRFYNGSNNFKSIVLGFLEKKKLFRIRNEFWLLKRHLININLKTKLIKSFLWYLNITTNWIDPIWNSVLDLMCLELHWKCYITVNSLHWYW